MVTNKEQSSHGYFLFPIDKLHLWKTSEKLQDKIYRRLPFRFIYIK